MLFGNNGPASGRGSGEQPDLAQALESQKHCLFFLYSHSCKLCTTIDPDVNKLCQDNRDWLRLATACTDDQHKWAPELLHYGVERVPCFVLLQPGGNAIAKTGAPRDRRHMIESLDTMISYAKLKAVPPKRKRWWWHR